MMVQHIQPSCLMRMMLGKNEGAARSTFLQAARNQLAWSYVLRSPSFRPKKEYKLASYLTGSTSSIGVGGCKEQAKKHALEKGQQCKAHQGAVFEQRNAANKMKPFTT
eukprot:1160495-Pelagomonas_calceolata.AAC.18